MFRIPFLILLLSAFLLTSCAQAVPQNTPQPGEPTNESYPIDNPPTNPDTSTYPAPQTGAQNNSDTSSYPYPGDKTSAADPALIDNPYTPSDTDVKWVRGKAYIDKAGSSLTVTNENLTQATLHLVGNLPNPCYQLRVEIKKPDDKNRIEIQVYAVADPDKVCAEVLQPFDVQVPLGEFASAKYSVYVNDELFGEFGR